MSIFSYHLITLPIFKAIKNIFSNPIDKNTSGLIYAEYMTAMTLGAPIFSTSRILFGEVALVMQWENEETLNQYLQHDTFGKELVKGWHVRLSFLRKWGAFTGFTIPEEEEQLDEDNTPVVAVTIARLKPLALLRFIKWGRPVEKLVSDHPGTVLSLASVKFLNTFSTFSIWKNQNQMSAMVHGHSNVQQPKRHSNAMKERNRKDFHFEFITLRFRPIAEYGSYKGKQNYVERILE